MKRTIRFCNVLVCLCFAMLMSTSQVWGNTGSSAYHLSAELGTNFPLDMGGRVMLEVPGRLRLSTSLGVFPGFYLSAVNGIMVGVGAYNQATADLLAVVLNNALVWRTHLEWRPWQKSGFYFGVGYGMAVLAGAIGDEALLTQAMGKEGSGGSKISYQISSMLHMIDAEVGWEFWLWKKHLYLRVALGFSGTVGSTAKVESYGGVKSGGLSPLTTAAEEYLNMIYRSYIFTPTMSLALGYRFF